MKAEEERSEEGEVKAKRGGGKTRRGVEEQEKKKLRQTRAFRTIRISMIHRTVLLPDSFIFHAPPQFPIRCGRQFRVVHSGIWRDAQTSQSHDDSEPSSSDSTRSFHDVWHSRKRSLRERRCRANIWWLENGIVQWEKFRL